MRNVSFKANPKDEWMPDKGIGHEYKVDGGVAAIMAYGLLLFVQDEEVARVSTYEPTEEDMAAMEKEWEEAMG
jgi:hypothetical protein